MTAIILADEPPLQITSRPMGEEYTPPQTKKFTHVLHVFPNSHLHQRTIKETPSPSFYWVEVNHVGHLLMFIDKPIKTGCNIGKIDIYRPIPYAEWAEPSGRGFQIMDIDVVNPNISWTTSGGMTFPVFNPMRYQFVLLQGESMFQVYFPEVTEHS